MAIADFDQLKEKIKLWAERTDLSDDLIEDFIFMAEADASQLLRVPAMEYEVLLTVTDSRVTIPFDFMSLRRLTWDSGGCNTTLEYLSWDDFVRIDNEQATQPQYFSRQGPTWYIHGNPGDGTEILCNYYGFIPQLTEDVPDNWLLVVSPQAYLYGSLKYLFEYIMDNERAAYWEAKFMRELEKLQGIADRAEHSGTILTVRPVK